MSQMINDTLQNVYNRLAMLGKSITALQTKMDELNKNLDTKVQKLTETIVTMTDNNRKEGEAFQIVLEDTGKTFLTEINKLQSDIGLKDLNQLTINLKTIANASQEALKPETVDVLLDEVLTGIKSLMGGAPKPSKQPQQPQGGQ